MILYLKCCIISVLSIVLGDTNYSLISQQPSKRETSYLQELFLNNGRMYPENFAKIDWQSLEIQYFKTRSIFMSHGVYIYVYIFFYFFIF